MRIANCYAVAGALMYGMYTLCTYERVYICTIVCCTWYLALCTQYGKFSTWYPIPGTYYLAPGRSMHQYAPVCIRMYSYASVTHPNAPICFHTPPLRIPTPIFTLFQSKPVKSRTQQKHKFRLTLWNVKSGRIQLNITAQFNMGNTHL